MIFDFIKERILKQEIHGYKAVCTRFNRRENKILYFSNWGNFHWEINETYIIKNKIKICSNGFHFCKTPKNILKFYSLSISELYNPVFFTKCIAKDVKSVSLKSVAKQMTLKEIIPTTEYFENISFICIKKETEIPLDIFVSNYKMNGGIYFNTPELFYDFMNNTIPLNQRIVNYSIYQKYKDYNEGLKIITNIKNI